MLKMHSQKRGRVSRKFFLNGQKEAALKLQTFLTQKNRAEQQRGIGSGPITIPKMMVDIRCS